MTEFAVRAESRDGIIIMLRRNFATREDAESYPVRLSGWKRVWVEPVELPPAKPDDGPPPLPWSICWKGQYTYIIDANGKKIGVVLGTLTQRKHIEEMIVRAFR